jgi:hypothetical protein
MISPPPQDLLTICFLDSNRDAASPPGVVEAVGFDLLGTPVRWVLFGLSWGASGAETLLTGEGPPPWNEDGIDPALVAAERELAIDGRSKGSGLDRDVWFDRRNKLERYVAMAVSLFRSSTRSVH